MTDIAEQAKASKAEKKEMASAKGFYLSLRLKKALKKTAVDLTPPILYKLFVPNARRRHPSDKFLHGKNGAPLTLEDIHPSELAFLARSVKMTIPISHMRYAGGLRFDPEQHHFVRYLRDGISALKTFYARHQPENVVEKHFVKTNSKLPMPLKGLPWMMFALNEFDRNVMTEKGLAASHGHQHHGPVSPEKIALEAAHLDRLLASFKKNGLIDNEDYPSGHFLVDTNGDWAFYVKDGQHRISVMAHLGFKDATVSVTGGGSASVSPSTADDWPMVRRKMITKQAALAVLRAYTAPNRKLDIFD